MVQQEDQPHQVYDQAVADSSIASRARVIRTPFLVIRGSNISNAISENLYEERELFWETNVVIVAKLDAQM